PHLRRPLWLRQTIRPRPPRPRLLDRRSAATYTWLMTATFTTRIDIDGEGLARISGARIKVMEVVLDKITHGWRPEAMHFQHPNLSLAQIHAALTFYYENQTQLDTQIAERRDEASHLHEQVSGPEFPNRLRTSKPSR